MGLTHIRTPKNFVLENRLERYAAAIEQRPEIYRGCWGEACAPCGGAACGDVTRSGAPCGNAPCGSASHDDMPGFGSVHLDLGCGKGAYLVARAQREPDALFIGMDTEPICIAYAAQNIVETGLSNAIVLPRSADSIERLFGPGELAGITLNFPTPFPKRKFARKRLISVDHLLSYRRVLAPGATVTLRTDSQPLHDFTLTQLDAAGYRVLWASIDTRAEHPEHPETESSVVLPNRGPPYTASAPLRDQNRRRCKFRPAATPSRASSHTFPETSIPSGTSPLVWKAQFSTCAIASETNRRITTRHAKRALGRHAALSPGKFVPLLGISFRDHSGKPVQSQQNRRIEERNYVIAGEK